MTKISFCIKLLLLYHFSVYLYILVYIFRREWISCHYKKRDGFDVTVLPRSVGPGPAQIFSQRQVCLGVDANTQSCHLGCAHIKNIVLLTAYQEICDMIFYLTATWSFGLWWHRLLVPGTKREISKWITLFCSHLKHLATINSDGTYICPCSFTLCIGDSGCVANPCVCINHLFFVNAGFYPFLVGHCLMLPPDRAVFVLEDKEVTQDSGCGAK